MLRRDRFGEYAVVQYLIPHRCFIQCICCLKSAVGNQNSSICEQPLWNSASASRSYFLIFIFPAHHCPSWPPCGLQLCFPPLRYLLTMCFLSQQAPSSLLEALEQHLASLEGKKVKDSTAASRYVNPSFAFSPFLLSPSGVLEDVLFWLQRGDK